MFVCTDVQTINFIHQFNLYSQSSVHSDIVKWTQQIRTIQEYISPVKLFNGKSNKNPTKRITKAYKINTRIQKHICSVPNMFLNIRIRLEQTFFAGSSEWIIWRVHCVGRMMAYWKYAIIRLFTITINLLDHIFLFQYYSFVNVQTRLKELQTRIKEIPVYRNVMFSFSNLFLY